MSEQQTGSPEASDELGKRIISGIAQLMELRRQAQAQFPELLETQSTAYAALAAVLGMDEADPELPTAITAIPEDAQTPKGNARRSYIAACQAVARASRKPAAQVSFEGQYVGMSISVQVLPNNRHDRPITKIRFDNRLGDSGPQVLGWPNSEVGSISAGGEIGEGILEIASHDSERTYAEIKVFAPDGQPQVSIRAAEPPTPTSG